MVKVENAELVIGIVGRMGVNTKELIGWISDCLHKVSYKTKHIKLTEYLKTKPFEFELKDEPIEERYISYINACNEIRKKADRTDFFVTYAVQKIIEIRKDLTGSENTPASRHAYIIDQIKRPEEAESLSNIYGQQFILVSAHMPSDELKEALSKKIAQGHAQSPKQSKWEAVAAKLIDQDAKESTVPMGQRVSDVFPKADLILNAAIEKDAKDLLDRFLGALFGNFQVSPNKPEFYQNIAYHVSLTSCDTGRQVGAAIESKGQIAATGFNEAPKAFGGTYWAGEELDGRDVTVGTDANTIRKRQMVAEIIQILRDNKELKNNDLKDHEIESKFLDEKSAVLKKSQIMDSLEYGRSVHAEMAAITSAARLGISVDGGSLYCTTFPCHNCAKHIVATGIKDVSYIEPFAKSFADELYPDSIQIDSSNPNSAKVQFKQFIGITPTRYRELFSKERFKDVKGNVIPWKPRESHPVLEKLDESHTDREVIFQKAMLDFLDNETAIYLGLKD